MSNVNSNQITKMVETWYANRGFHMLLCLKNSPDRSFIVNLRDKLTVGIQNVPYTARQKVTARFNRVWYNSKIFK